VATTDVPAGDDVEVLAAPPALRPLLGRAALGALPALPLPGLRRRPGGSGASLPAARLGLRGVRVDAASVAAYAEVCGFRLTSHLPPTYPHLVGFPLSLALMSRPDFPFGLLGMVHVRNRVEVRRPIGLDEPLDVTAAVADLRPHPKGQQLDNVVEVRVGDELVWTSTSTYLKRGAGGTAPGGAAPDEVASPVDELEVASLPLTAVWRVDGDVGRRYGAVSGDRNPIHLSALTARPFGFPKAIAHGMWTKARALAGLDGRLPPAFAVDVAFKRPVLLPATVEYATAPLPPSATAGDADGGWALGVRSRKGDPHLAGIVSPLG
jgi:acyl dehydratase